MRREKLFHRSAIHPVHNRSATAALNVLCDGWDSSSAIDQPMFVSYSIEGQMDFEIYATRFVMG